MLDPIEDLKGLDAEVAVPIMLHRMVDAMTYDGRATDTFKGFSGRIYTAELWYRMDQEGVPRHVR